MKLTVSKEGVLLDDQAIRHCTQVDIKNISFNSEGMEVALHVFVQEADIQWKIKE